MDSKVRQMIKLIEVDEDSFVRRADMYFKRRPELMKLVEEFYRAYRALAERYDHATGVIRQAHWAMEENQIQFVMDDGSAVSGSDSDPRLMEFTEESDSSGSIKGLKQLP
ncbi:Protein NETWORKED 1A [Ancistrocladus abbreviatus]